MSIYHSRFIVHFYTVVAPRVASCIAVQAKHPVRVCFTWGHSHARVYTRVEESSPLEPRHGTLLCPLVARWPRSIRMSIRITATERARNNFCSWDWSHCGWIVDPFSWPCCTSAPALPPFQSSSLQEKTTQLSSFIVLRPFRSIQRPRFHSLHSIPFTTGSASCAPCSDRCSSWNCAVIFFFFQLDWANFKSVCTWRHEWKINVTTNR